MAINVFHVLKVSRREAAIRQIEHAIIAFRNGNYDVATTLAGAAEEMQTRDNQRIRKLLLQKLPAGLSEKDAIRNLRESHNWLKHDRPEGDRCFYFVETGYAILMAASCWEPATPAITDFANEWYEALEFFVNEPELQRLIAKEMSTNPEWPA